MPVLTTTSAQQPPVSSGPPILCEDSDSYRLIGDANGQNVGASGIGVFDGKTGAILDFRKIYGTTGLVSSLVGQYVQLALQINGLTAASVGSVLSDTVAFYKSGTGHRQIPIKNLVTSALLNILPDDGDMLWKTSFLGIDVVSPLNIGSVGQQMVVASSNTPGWATAKRNIQLLAAGAKGTQTSPAGDTNRRPEEAETSSNKVNYWYMAFDPSSPELCFWPAFTLPNWNGGNFKYRVAWTAASGAGDSVAWELKGLGLSDSDAFDSAFGTAKTVVDTLDTADDLQWSPWSTEDLTLGNSSDAGDAVIFHARRNTAHGSDDLAVDARLALIDIIYTTASYTDSS